MSTDKANLSKLIVFLKEIANQDGNEWFKEELINSISSGKAVSVGGEVSEIIDDLKRSRFYLKSIDRTMWIEAFNYYSNVKFPDLRLELIGDYKEMKLADKNDDIIEFTRRIVMQLENCINAICTLKDAHSTISSSPERFKNNKTDLLTGDFAFFNKDRTPKEINKISIQSKIFFIKQIYNVNYSFSDMNEMITIRNKSSHRGDLSVREKEIIEKAKLNKTERKSSYFKCFDTFYNCMTDLRK